jgi:transcription elongation GreA/GreB family factor
MSRAFVKESDGTELDDLPELVVSPHRNLVTAEGLGLIESTLERLEAELTAARRAVDRESVARAERDLRYWRQRRATAEVVAAPERMDVVRFGSTVTLETAAGEEVRYRIVGEDESDPRHGQISYVSPLAEALLGCRPGDTVALRDGDAEILAIS